MRLKSRRGYTAQVLAQNEERVIYNSYDEEGKPLQLNNSRSPKSFFEEFSKES